MTHCTFDDLCSQCHAGGMCWSALHSIHDLKPGSMGDFGPHGPGPQGHLTSQERLQKRWEEQSVWIFVRTSRKDPTLSDEDLVTIRCMTRKEFRRWDPNHLDFWMDGAQVPGIL